MCGSTCEGIQMRSNCSFITPFQEAAFPFLINVFKNRITYSCILDTLCLRTPKRLIRGNSLFNVHRHFKVIPLAGSFAAAARTLTSSTRIVFRSLEIFYFVFIMTNYLLYNFSLVLTLRSYFVHLDTVLDSCVVIIVFVLCYLYFYVLFPFHCLSLIGFPAVVEHFNKRLNYSKSHHRSSLAVHVTTQTSYQVTCTGSEC